MTPEQLKANPPATVEEVHEALASGDPEALEDVKERWFTVWPDPGPDYANDIQLIADFLDNHYVRVLVTSEEHAQLGKAKAGSTRCTFGTLGPVGEGLRRYRRAGIRVAAITDSPATIGDLVDWG